MEPWCFAHWPGANCFITHHCASKNQKMKMLTLYDNFEGYESNSVLVEYLKD